jgi:ribonucleoside-diphosphate reductase alpha chain
MNLYRWEEWKNTNAVQIAIWFLDGVMEEFIQKAKNINGFERAVRFAEKSRALGLGVFGLHSLYQLKGFAFDSFQSYLLNNQIFKHLREQAEIATKELAKEYGEPEWCKGFERRNSHLLSLAPTVTNSLISGNLSPSIEPWAANAFAQKTAKGTILQRNKELEKILITKEKTTR